MASIMKPLSFFFLVMLFSSMQIEASDRLFFNKVIGSNNNYNAVEDPKLPLSYKQNPKLAPEVATLTTQSQKVATTAPQKQPSFSFNQYGGYGLVASKEDTSAATDAISNYENQKNNNNDGDNFIYNMENVKGNGNDNIWDELKKQGISDTRSFENGQYTFDLGNANKNRIENGYDAAWRGSTRNEGYDGESEKQKEFDSLEEYEKYLKRSGYLP